MHKLYCAPGACSFVPHVGLELIKAATGQDFETHLVKLHKGEQKQPEFLALNPNGQVPVLTVDGKPLHQIVAICEYLDRVFPQVGLLPADAWERAQALSMLAWFNNTVHPTFTHFFMPSKFAEDDAAHTELKRVAAAQYRPLLERIEAQIKNANPYWLGAKPSMLDAYALTLFRWGGFTGIDPDSMPVYKAYIDRVAAHPQIAEVVAREGIKLSTFQKA
ncbi:MAG: glutathione S-transferase family protein [Burkholderiaceae bacterium]